jgi:hypothetical protein
MCCLELFQSPYFCICTLNWAIQCSIWWFQQKLWPMMNSTLQFCIDFILRLIQSILYPFLQPVVRTTCSVICEHKPMKTKEWHSNLTRSIFPFGQWKCIRSNCWYWETEMRKPNKVWSVVISIFYYAPWTCVLAHEPQDSRMTPWYNQPSRLGWNLTDLAGFFKRKTLLNGWLIWLIISSEQAIFFLKLPWYLIQYNIILGEKSQN